MHLILAFTLQCAVFGADLAKNTFYMECPYLGTTKPEIEVQHFQTQSPVTAQPQPTGKLKP